MRLTGSLTATQSASSAAIGDTTNLAARLQSLARPGQAVVAASTARRAGNIRLESLGTVEVKGRSEPVEIFALASET